MLKQTLLLLFFVSSLIIFAETSYDVLLKDNTTISGYILEDKPGELIVLESEDNGEIFVIEYVDIVVVKAKTTGVITEDVIQDSPELITTDTAETIPDVVPIIIPNIELPKIELNTKVDIELFQPDIVINELADMSLFELSSFDFKEENLESLTPGIKLKIYDEISKSDTLKFTLLNIVPGLGSMLQGDYYAGLYTLSSVLGSVLYNVVGSNTGTDYYFIVNLNGALAYASSFLAPLRYNLKYNETIKDKLSLRL
jgi:hypothetical protein